MSDKDIKHPHLNPSPTDVSLETVLSQVEGLKKKDKDEGPYPGLRPYREDEKGKFFGRDTDTEILIDKVLTNRLTLLFAASGVGKSSLLQAAVIPHLKSKTGENLAVVYHIDWVSDPVRSVGDAVLAGLRSAELLPDDVGDEERGETLADLLGFCGLFVRPPLVLILDQFEEFFRYQRHQPSFQKFIDQLTVVVTNKALPVSLVISMREDFALELNAFKPRLPTILFENFYRLEKLGRRAVRDAIVIPAKQRGFAYEPKLLDQLLTDLLSRELDRQPNSPVVEMLETVEPPYLQIVCARLWELNKDDPKQTLRLASYEKAGRAQGILKNYLDGVLQQFSAGEKQLASLAFDHLVSNRGVKMAYTAEALAETLRVDAGELGAVLKKLEEVRVLREMPREEALWYELYHDMFSGSIEDWNNAWKDRMRRRRAAKVAGGVVFGVAALVAGWDYYLNVSNYHFRLSPKLSSEQVELWRGKPGSWDLFGVQEYVAETGVKRHELEPDKQFHTKLIGDYDELQMELAGNQSIERRIKTYAMSGEFQKAFELSEKVLMQKDSGVERVISNFIGISTPETVRSIYKVLRQSKSTSVQVAVEKSSCSLAMGIVFFDEFGFDSTLEFFWDKWLPMQVATFHGRENIKDKLLSDYNNLSLSALLNYPITDDLIDILIDLVRRYTDSKDYIYRSDQLFFALDLLANLKAEKAIPVIEDLLSNDRKDVSEKAFYTLLAISKEFPSLDFLESYKKSKHYNDLIFIDAVVKSKAESELSSILKIFKSENISASASASAALKTLKPQGVVSELLALINDDDMRIRSLVAETLGAFDDKKSIPPLINLMDDKYSSVRVSAINALGLLEASSAVPRIINSLKDSSGTVRASAAKILGKLKAKQGVDDLIILLGDDYDDARFSAAEALALLKSNKAIAGLFELLDGDYSDRAAGIKALSSFSTVDLMPTLIDLLKGARKSTFKYSVADIFDELDDESLLDVMSKLLAENNRTLHYNIADIIKGMNNKSIKSVVFEAFHAEKEKKLDFFKLLDSEDFWKKDVYDLVELRTKYNVSAFIEELRSENESTRSGAITDLTILMHKESISSFSEFLSDEYEDKNVRQAAAKALSYFPMKREVIPQLLNVLTPCEHENESYGQSQLVHTALDTLLLSDIENLNPNFLPVLDGRNYRFAWDSGIYGVEAYGNIASGEIIDFLIRHLKGDDFKMRESAIIAALRMKRGGNLNFIEKRIIEKALKMTNSESNFLATKRLLAEDEKKAKREMDILYAPVNKPGLEEKVLSQKELKQKIIQMDQDYVEWRKQRDTKGSSDTSPEQNKNLSNPAPFIYEYAYAIAHESEADGIELLGHNLYKVREAAARGLANSDALSVNLLRKLEKKWLATKDPIERQGIYHAIDIALLAIEGVGYEKELADLKIYEQELIDNKEQRSIDSIKPRVEWTKIQLQWRVDANKELEELAARQLPKLLKDYCLNEDGTDIPEEKCTIAH